MGKKTDTAKNFILGYMKSIPYSLTVREIYVAGGGKWTRSTIERRIRDLRTSADILFVGTIGREKMWDLANWQTIISSVSPTNVPIPTQSSDNVAFSSMPQLPPPSYPTLYFAVHNIVMLLVGGREVFSAWDVTKELRRLSNLGQLSALDLDEVGTVRIDHADVPRIDHSLVRDEVHRMYYDGKMAGYDRRVIDFHWEYYSVA